VRSTLYSLLFVTLLLFAAAPSSAADTEFSLTDQEGKVVVLDFWASWCTPCRRSFPWLNDMHAKYQQQGLVIIGVNLDASREDASEFLEKYPARFRIHFDTNAALATEYGVEAMPSSFVIGRDGELKATHLGFKVRQQAEYEAILIEALGEQP